MKKHWYRIHIAECPVCGRDNSARERIYGEKPKDPQLIYVHVHPMAAYCGCLEYDAAMRDTF